MRGPGVSVGVGLGDAKVSAGDGVVVAVGDGVADALAAGRLPTDSTTISSVARHWNTPSTSSVATMTPMLVQKTTKAGRDLFTAES
jgi:hypothetical protein